MIGLDQARERLGITAMEAWTSGKAKRATGDLSGLVLFERSEG